MSSTRQPLVAMYTYGQSAWLIGEVRVADGLRRARRDDRGEGVISAAIAVLIMAFLGAAMWVGFKQIWDTTETKVTEQVNEIGG